MSSITSQLIVRLIDHVSGPATAAGNSLRRLIAQSNARAGAGLSALGQQLNTITTRAQEAGRRATNAVATAAIPAAVGVAAAYRTALDYSRELNFAAGIGELTTQQQRDVARTAREIGASTQFTATQAVAMQRALIAAGRTVEQAQGMTRPILNTALAGQVSPERAADGIIAISSAYRLAMPDIASAAAQATRVGDIVARAANESRASFDDILQGFKYAAPMAHAAGMSMEQLAAAIAHMTNNGLRGDEAGTAIRSMLVRMVKPTNDARQAMAELGLSFEQFFGRMKDFNISNFTSGMRNVGQRFNAAQQATISAAVARNAARPEGERQDLGVVLTEATISALNIPARRVQDRQKIARAVQRYVSSLMEGANPDGLFEALERAGATPGHMARVFDSRQGSRLMTMIGPGYQDILKRLQTMAAGSSERMAARMEEGLYGAHMRVKSAIEAIILSISESGVADRIAELMTKIAVAFRQIAETDPGRLRAIGYALIGLAAAAPIGLALLGVVAVFKALAAAGALLLAVLSPVGAVIMAVVAAFAALAVYAYRNWDGLTSAASGFAAAITERFPNASSAISGVATKIGELLGWLDSLIGKSSASTAEWWAWGLAMGTAVADGIEAFGRFAANVATKVDEVVTYVATLPQRMAAAVGTGAVALYEAGARLIQSLIDGIKSKVAELMAYVQSIPGRITGALGSIRLPGFGGGAAASPAPAGARASGGPVSAGQSYVVGERGREIFSPGQSGWINPNRGGAGGAGRAGVGTFNFAPAITVSGSAGEDPAKLAARIKRELEDSFAQALRGLHADYGPSFG